jgi:hypothetical protein
MVTKRGAAVVIGRCVVALLAVLSALAVAAGRAPAATYWVPTQTNTFQWELDNSVDPTVDAQVYDVDLFTTDASVVSALHAQGRHVICYLDAGSWEAWRPDANAFPASVLGNTYAGYSDERWLDVRQLSILEPIITARIQLCHDKGFDGVEFDNIDGWQVNTGFPLTAADSITYDEWLANTAHAFNLNVAMKSDVDQVADLEPYFDWNLDEECYQYNECAKLLPFVADDKAVLEVEYSTAVGKFCPQANADGFMGMRKNLALGPWQSPCWPTGNWVGRTGTDGYAAAGLGASGTDLVSLPNATMTVVQGATTVWGAGTTDMRALESPDGTTRTAAAWSDPTAVKVNLSFSAPYSGDLHLYALDGDSTARRETVAVGGASSTELTTGDFAQGQWLSFPISMAAGETIPITITRTAGTSAVLSGLFLSDDHVVSSSPQGNWTVSTGSNGYVLPAVDGGQDVSSLANATVTLLQGDRTVWASGTTDSRALESPDGQSRTAAGLTDPNQVRASLRFTAAFSGDLHLYAVDWDSTARRETISVATPFGTHTVPLSNDFSQGAWVVVPISVAAGNTVTITAARTAGTGAELSGLFLGEGTSQTGQPPTVSITSPADGTTYTAGDSVKADYSCMEGAGGPGIQSCTGTVASGAPIDTSTVGSHSFTVVAVSRDALITTKTVTYTVAAALPPEPPVATITTPRDGAEYVLGQFVTAGYSCQDGARGTGIQSCTGTVANGAAIDTSTTGSHGFTVTAISNDGLQATATAHYTVTTPPVPPAPPIVTVTKPADGATFTVGDHVTADYACIEGAGGPGIRSCAGTVAAGTAIDTATAGEHAFTVTATSDDGLETTATVRYAVNAAPPLPTTTPTTTIAASPLPVLPPTTTPTNLDIGLGTGSLVNTRGATTVSITCAAKQSFCDGSVTLTTTKNRRTLALGTAHFRISGGSTATVRVGLSKPELAKLGHANPVRVLVSTAARDDAGHQGAAHRTTMLYLALDQTPPVMTIASGVLTANRGSVTVSLGCPASQSACSGTVTLSTVNGHKPPVLLGSTAFFVARDTTILARLRLARSALRTLAQTTSIRVTITVTANNRAGHTGTARRAATLRLLPGRS